MKIQEVSRKMKTLPNGFLKIKTGYDVQYAAAAVMMFRYYGIPSRYVEGYLLTPETVKEAGTAETVTVSQKYAHAWPEIYLDGIGWIPVEVTPKYENVMGTPYYETQETAVSNSSSSDQSLENDDKKKQEKQQEQKRRKRRDNRKEIRKENSRNTAADSAGSLKAKQRWKNGS